MWWIVAFVVIFGAVAFIIARRGPGDGLDHSADGGRHDPYGGSGQIGSGGPGDGGGGF